MYPQQPGWGPYGQPQPPPWDPRSDQAAKQRRSLVAMAIVLPLLCGVCVLGSVFGTKDPPSPQTTVGTGLRAQSSQAVGTATPQQGNAYAITAQSLAAPRFLSFRLQESLPNDVGVTAKYTSPGLPVLVLVIAYATQPRSRTVPPGSRRITVHGHQGIRTETEGMSMLGWSNGPWGFILTTRSDQGPGEMHVVDVFAELLATYADQHPSIRSVIDGGVVSSPN